MGCLSHLVQRNAQSVLLFISIHIIRELFVPSDRTNLVARESFCLNLWLLYDFFPISRLTLSFLCIFRSTFWTDNSDVSQYYTPWWGTAVLEQGFGVFSLFSGFCFHVGPANRKSGILICSLLISHVKWGYNGLVGCSRYLQDCPQLDADRS